MIVNISDELKQEVSRWFFENIEDHVYSEALYDLLKILDENEVILWRRLNEAENEAEKLEAEVWRIKDDNLTLRDKLKQLEKDK